MVDYLVHGLALVHRFTFRWFLQYYSLHIMYYILHNIYYKNPAVSLMVAGFATPPYVVF